MNEQIIERLENSFNLLAPRGPELVDRFYAHLFSKHPDLRSMFPQDMAGQKKKLLGSIVLVIENIRKSEQLHHPLTDMGRRHHQYGCTPAQYPIVRDTLIGVMKDMAGEAWNNDFEDAWSTALNLIAGIMIEGQKAEAKAPKFAELAKA